MTSKCLVLPDGSKWWMKDKKLHNKDGPALINKEYGFVGFYLEGKRYTFNVWADKVNLPLKKRTYLFLKYSDKDKFKDNV